MGFKLPDEWYEIFDEILETLYEYEREKWNTPSSQTWLYRKNLSNQIDADSAVIEHFFEYLQEIEYITQVNERSSPRKAFEITEKGAQAYETRIRDSESKGFE
jgi:predicted transcriptional regulator